MGVIQFRAQLQPRGPAAAMVLGDDQVAAIGEGARRFPVVATVNGYTWRTTVTRMGGEFLLGLSREVREGAGVAAGDEVDLTIELDEAPREVEVPAALAAALATDPQAQASFERMASPTGRRTPAGSRRPSRRRPGSDAPGRRST